MSIPPDPHEPTRADLPPVGGEPTRPLTMPAGPADEIRPEPIQPRPGRPLPPDDREDRRQAWWLWALLAAVLLGIVLFALLREGDDEGDVDATGETTTSAPATQDTTAPETSAPTAPTDEGAATTAPPTETTEATPDPAAGSSEASDLGTALTPDGTDLLGVVQGDAGDAERLAPYADEDVIGSRVEVLEVVEGEGFWIGVDDQRRIFAHPSAGVAGEVAVGQRIDFDGFLKPNPPADSADVHDIPEDQGAELHRHQGHHLELRSFTVTD